MDEAIGSNKQQAHLWCSGHNLHACRQGVYKHHCYSLVYLVRAKAPLMKSVRASKSGMPARVAADGRRVVAPALSPALGAAGSPGAGVKAATGPEAPLEGQERSRPRLPCWARVPEEACPLGSGSGR